MRRKLVLAAVLCLALLITLAMASPAAQAGATFITYTAQETPVTLDFSPMVPSGSVLKMTMANHLRDSGATHPWGNCDVYTHSSWVIHTVDGVPTGSTFRGSYETKGAYGSTEGWFTGSMSWITGEMFYRFSGKGVSGDLIGTVWTGQCHSPSFPALPTQMSVRVLVPGGLEP